jgi:hypothetical protein
MHDWSLFVDFLRVLFVPSYSISSFLQIHLAKLSLIFQIQLYLQIVRADAHYLSFVQLRGSIPLYWSQAGIKYRPPPKLEKSMFCHGYI